MTRSIESAVEAVNDAAAAFIAARAHVVTCQTAVRVKRQSVAAAIANGRASFPIISREQLVRQELAANQAHKLALARGEIEPAEAPRIANSIVGRTAAYGRGTDTNAFMHGQLRTGFRRGGTTRRLPSDR
jgi:hypothetical protein